MRLVVHASVPEVDGERVILGGGGGGGMALRSLSSIAVVELSLLLSSLFEFVV